MDAPGRRDPSGDEMPHAEDICRAVTHGEVDAFVIAPTEAEARVLILAKADASFRRLVEDMLQGAVTVAASGEVLYANPAFGELVGWLPEELVGRRLHGLVDAADAREIDEMLAGPAEGGGLRARLRTREDGAMLATFCIACVADGATTLLVTEGAGDAGESARATLDAIRSGSVDAFVLGEGQVALLDSAQAPYRALVERMGEGAVTVSSDGTIAYANPRFASMLGAPAGSVVGRAFVDFVDEADRVVVAAMVRSGTVAQREFRLRALSGDLVPVQASMTALDEHRLLLLSDVVRSRAHAASNEIARRFLGLLARELDEILGPVAKAARELRRAASGAADASALDVIERSTQRLEGLAGELRRVYVRE